MDSTHAMIAQAWKDQTPHVRLDRIFGVTHVSRDNCGKEKAIDASRSMQSIERSLDVNVAVEVPLIPLVNQVGRMVLNDITQFMQQKTGIKNQTHTVS
ncbi:unnamed protein product [Brassica oleracea var. botrytis]